jgi:hypothetical protein
MRIEMASYHNPNLSEPWPGEEYLSPFFESAYVFVAEFMMK